VELTEKLPIGTRVRFTEEWLTRMGPGHLKRYSGRIGVISGYRGQVSDVPEPIVHFPKHGRFKEEKLFEVRWSRLELAEQQAE
jgi:hypothetical protein